MRSGPKLAFMLFLVLAALRAQSGMAQDVSSPQEDEQQKKAYTEFHAGRYQEALQLYVALYSSTNNPSYLRNMAVCYEKVGNADEAVRTYRQYLEQARDMTPDKRQTIEGTIKKLEEKIAQSQPPAQPPSNLTQSAPPAPSPPPSPYPSPADVYPTQPTPMAPPASASSNAGSGLRIAGFVAGGAGVISVALGAYFGSQAKSAATEIQGKATPGISFDMLKSIDDRGRSDQTKQWIFLGAGAGLLIGGGVLYLLGNSSGSEPAAGSTTAMTFAPAIAPHGFGGSLQGRF